MIFNIVIADCRQQLAHGWDPEQPPVVMIERPLLYTPQPGEREPGRVGTWLTPVGGIPLDESDLEWDPKRWSTTRSGKYVTVILNRYLIAGSDPRLLSAACLKMGLMAASALTGSGKIVEEIRIVQGDVTQLSQVQMAIYVGLAFRIKE